MRIFVWLLTLSIFIGCGSVTTVQTVHLSQIEPLPSPKDTEVEPLRVAIAAIISPQGTLASYQPLLDYMSAELDRPVKLVQRQTYAEINELVKNQEVDLAFVCTTAYVLGKREFDMELLVTPQVNGMTVYHSFIITPIDSPAQSMRDLRGKVFAFTDPLSTTGRIYPTFLAQEMGSTPDTFFARSFFTYSHDDAIQAVVNGIADGAAVDSLVYDFAIQRDPSLVEQIRVIHHSPAFGAPPVVVHPNVRPQLRAALQNTLLELPNTLEGKQVLSAMGIDGFVIVDDTHYDAVRQLFDEVEGLN